MIKARRLPYKPSDLLSLALRDLARCEASKEYFVSMHVWHIPSSSGKQHLVCLAGAVMALTLNTDPKTKCPMPRDFPNRITLKLNAINFLRMGLLKLAVVYMNQRFPEGVPEVVRVTPYGKNRQQWWRDMRRIVRLLRKAGL